MSDNTSPNRISNVPLYSLIATIALVVAAVVLVIFAPPDKQGFTVLLGLLVTTIPSVVASIYSERASRDIRNGILVEKAKEGAKEAIAESQVLTRTGPVVSAELRALSRLLEANTVANRETKTALEDNGTTE